MNNYGLKLLSLCKENGLCIVNGRKESGKCTFNSVCRNKPVSSLVDYLIVSKECYGSVDDMCVFDENEYSDHCPVTFTLRCSDVIIDYENQYEYDKIVWGSSSDVDILEIVRNKSNVFNEINEKLLSGEFDINECINLFSDTVYDISFSCYGKTFSKRHKRTKRKSLWFNDECREAKSSFYKTKRAYASENSEPNKLLMLNARKYFIKVKRRAKYRFYNNEKVKLANMSKASPRKFWSYIKKFKNTKAGCGNISLEDFKNYFENVSNEQHGNFNFEDVQPDGDVLFIVEYLDQVITVDEVKKTIQSMKRFKSCDFDNNVADFFIDANSVISPYLCTIFNYIFDNGNYPEAWFKGVIVPVFKKGDRNIPSNYRGITLVNVMGKLYF